MNDVVHAADRERTDRYHNHGEADKNLRKGAALGACG